MTIKAPNLFKTNMLINLFLREGGWGRNKRGIASKWSLDDQLIDRILTTTSLGLFSLLDEVRGT